MIRLYMSDKRMLELGLSGSGGDGGPIRLSRSSPVARSKGYTPTTIKIVVQGEWLSGPFLCALLRYRAYSAERPFASAGGIVTM